MRISYPIPSARISSYVKSILVIENKQVTTPFMLPLFPNGTPTLLFTTAAGSLGPDKYNLVLFGQTVSPRQMLIDNDFKLIAYFLQPYALGALFNVPACELTDHPVSLDMFTGGLKLQEHLLNTADTDQLLRLIDDYLYSKIRVAGHEDKRIIYAAEKISRISDRSVLAAVQRELCMTERTFERLFDKYIGISPNQFRRINQFNNAFKHINSRTFSDLSMIAHRYGYADQSHFIRAFKEFTYLTPTSYLSQRPDA